MRKPLELWQFVISVMILIISAGTLIVNQSNKITAQDIRISELEQNKKDTKDQFDKVNGKIDQMSDKVNGKLDQMNDQISTIRISLEDKKNR